MNANSKLFELVSWNACWLAFPCWFGVHDAMLHVPAGDGNVLEGDGTDREAGSADSYGAFLFVDPIDSHFGTLVLWRPGVAITRPAPGRPVLRSPSLPPPKPGSHLSL